MDKMLLVWIGLATACAAATLVAIVERSVPFALLGFAAYAACAWRVSMRWGT